MLSAIGVLALYRAIVAAEHATTEPARRAAFARLYGLADGLADDHGGHEARAARDAVNRLNDTRGVIASHTRRTA